MSLLIPVPRSLRLAKAARFPVVAPYLTHHHLTDRYATPAEIITDLSPFRRSDVLRWICAIRGWLHDPQATTPKKQAELASQLLPEDLLERLRERSRSDEAILSSIVFHPRQQWFLLQLGILGCPENALPPEEETLKRTVGRCCLMVSDLLSQMEPVSPRNLNDPAQVNTWIAETLLPNLESSAGIETTARAQQFWFDIPESEPIRAKFKELSLPSLGDSFEKHYGIALRDFYLFVIIVHSRFTIHERSSSNPLLFDVRHECGQLFSEKTLITLLGLLSGKPDDLALNLLASPRQSWATDFTPLREVPLIEVQDGMLACPDSDLLWRCLTDRLYFLLEAANPREMISQLFGYIFEEYINELIGKFGVDSDFMIRTFSRSPKFHGTTDQAADGILLYSDVAIVMEYKSRRLTTRQKFGGAFADRITGIDQIIGAASTGRGGTKKGIGQLIKTLKRILSGERLSSGSSSEPFSIQHISRVHPALVVYGDVLGLEAIRQMAQEQFSQGAKKQGLSEDQLGKLLMLTVGDIEALEHVARRHPVEQTVKGYLQYVEENPRDKLGSLSSYLVNHQLIPEVGEAESQTTATYEKAMQWASEEVDARNSESTTV